MRAIRADNYGLLTPIVCSSYWSRAGVCAVFTSIFCLRMIIEHSIHLVNVSDESSHSRAHLNRPLLSKLPRRHSSRHDSTRGTMARARARQSASTASHPHHKSISKPHTHSSTSLDLHLHRSLLGAQCSATTQRRQHSSQFRARADTTDGRREITGIGCAQAARAREESLDNRASISDRTALRPERGPRLEGAR